MSVREELLKTKLTLVHIICYKCPIWDNKFPQNLLFCWLDALSFFPLFLSRRFFYELCICIKWDLLSLDTNLHKVQAIIGWREANYFFGKITLYFFFFLILTNRRQRLLTVLSQICKVSVFSKSGLINEGEEGKSERWYDSIKSHGKLTRKETRGPAQPPGHLATCPPARHLSFLFPPLVQVRYWRLRRREKARLSKEVRPTQQLLKITRTSQFHSRLHRKHVTFDLFPFQVFLAFSSLCNLIVKQHLVKGAACNCWLSVS